MANKVYQYYTELPSWAKGIVVIGGIAIVYFTTKQFIAKIKKQAESKDAKTSVDCFSVTEKFILLKYFGKICLNLTAIFGLYELLVTVKVALDAF